MRSNTGLLAELNKHFNCVAVCGSLDKAQRRSLSIGRILSCRSPFEDTNAIEQVGPADVCHHVLSKGNKLFQRIFCFEVEALRKTNEIPHIDTLDGDIAWRLAGKLSLARGIHTVTDNQHITILVRRLYQSSFEPPGMVVCAIEMDPSDLRWGPSQIDGQASCQILANLQKPMT